MENLVATVQSQYYPMDLDSLHSRTLLIRVVGLSILCFLLYFSQADLSAARHESTKFIGTK
ncbi:MAG: hypothetical protein V3U24_04100 [Candidatus Neomarinimicrobiota bacterium]